MALYDTLGIGYRELRQPDPRIGAYIRQGLGDARSIINVGAGAGSYEPRNCELIAVEPSSVMIAQRPQESAPVVRAVAEALPFADKSFDAALAILTIHHWPNINQGLQELARVASNKVVIFTFDPTVKYAWLIDYFPEFQAIDLAAMPPLTDIAKQFTRASIVNVPIPHNCSDGFLCAYWRRPRAYLNADVRAAISSFAKIADAKPGLAALEQDLDSGAWDKRYGELLTQTSLDCGYRLIIGDLS